MPADAAFCPTCGAATPAEREPSFGGGFVDRLKAALADRYRIERELGQGGMAIVYLARDLRHEREVALKVLRPDLAATLGPERFLREVTIAANLQHPHILPLYDSGETDGFLFYVMPYVEGESLRERLARHGELPLTDAIRVLRDVADALAAAHVKGVVHRDIKPENVMLSGRHAMVTDFGVAKAVSEATGRQSLTTAGVALGTPSYMAPEQAAASPHTDHRADIYAFGVTAYEILTGQPPFTGATPQAVLAAHITEQPVAVTERRATIPPSLAQLVMRCLEKKPADRPQSADELLPVLEGVLTPSGGMTPAATQPIVVARTPRSFIAAGAIVVIVAMVLAWRTFVGGPSGWEVVLEQTAPVTTDPELEIDPALSPDGKLLAYAVGTPLFTRIYVRQVDGGRPLAIGDSTGRPQRAPKWSPDGTRLLFCVGRDVMVAPALGGEARVLLTAEAGVVGADWSPDGREVVFVAAGEVRIADVESGQQRVLGEFLEPHSPAWSPDGTRVAVVVGNLSYIVGASYGNAAVSSIVLVPVDGDNDQVTISEGAALDVSPAWVGGGQGLAFVSDRRGSRDAYVAWLDGDGRLRGEPERVTSGLRIHSVAASRDGATLAYNVFAARANIWTLPIPGSGVALASDATPLTEGSQVIEHVSVSDDGQWVYFDSDRSGRPEIYRMPATGGAAVQLTDAAGGNYLAEPSPDGREIAFQSQRAGSRDIYVMPADGGAAEPVRVAPGDDNNPVWLPDGRTVAFTIMGSDEFANGVYTADRTPAGWSAPRGPLGMAPRSLTLTRDGRAWIQLGRDSIILHGIRDGSTRVLWRRRGLNVPGFIRMKFLPDGSRMSIRGREQGGEGSYVLWELPSAGGELRQVVRFDDPRRQPHWGGWDTDGKRVYFTLDERESDIWVADITLRER
jgi:serine/threonine-protein kinase